MWIEDRIERRTFVHRNVKVWNLLVFFLFYGCPYEYTYSNQGHAQAQCLGGRDVFYDKLLEWEKPIWA